MKDCWDIKHCKPSEYLNCPARQIGRNCWEVKKGCLCGIDKTLTCSNCFIYTEHFNELKNLIICARSKDVKALEELIKRYSQEVKRVQKGFFFPGGDSEDVFQEGLVGLYSAILAYDEKKDPVFENYLNKSIRNHIMQVLRKITSNKQKVLNNSVPLDHLDELISRKITPEDEVISNIYKAELEKTMEKQLTKLELKIIKLSLSDYSHKEISKFVKISTKQIENALFRARKKIFLLIKELNK